MLLTLRRFEFWILLGLVLTLPLLEAPKNLLWVAYVVTWITGRVQTKDFGGRWDRWDSIITLWIASTYVSNLFAGLENPEGWRVGNDLLRYGSVLWLVKRAQYDEKQLWWILGTVTVSTLLALYEASGQFFQAYPDVFLELRSVGHVNHSAIYLALSYGSTLAIVISRWDGLRWTCRIVGVSATIVLAMSVILSASRASLGAALMATLMMGVVQLRRSKAPLIVLVATLVTAVVLVQLSRVDVVRKLGATLDERYIVGQRLQIWNTAIAAWERYPVFGVGINNFKLVTEERVHGWLKKDGLYDDRRYDAAPHAHSLYLNTIAERGLVGFGAVMTVLVAWGGLLIRRLPTKTTSDIEWALWGGSMSAWLITVGVGAVNTTLHHEHGILAMLLFGSWLGFQRTPRQTD